MTQILPSHCFKGFIHKFIINCDENFIFRKQFTTSYSVNNFFSFLFSTNELNLSTILLNKENGIISLNESYFNATNKEEMPFRISRNIEVYILIITISITFHLLVYMVYSLVLCSHLRKLF